MEGLTCANFSWSLKGFHPCLSMWCAKCYISNDTMAFHVRSKPGLEDEEEQFKGAWKVVWYNQEYSVARDGDHLVTPFECDLCIFIKLKGQMQNVKSESDKRLASCMRRINLDAL